MNPPAHSGGMPFAFQVDREVPRPSQYLSSFAILSPDAEEQTKGGCMQVFSYYPDEVSGFDSGVKFLIRSPKRLQLPLMTPLHPP